MTKRFILLILAVTAAAAFVAGCGDDEAGGDDAGVTTSELSKAEYIKQAEEICTEADKRASKEAEDFFKGIEPNAKKFSEAVETIVLPSTEAQIDQISELGAPEGDEEQVEAMLAATRVGLDELEEVGKKAFLGLPPELKQHNKLAKKYGFKSCAFGF